MEINVNVILSLMVHYKYFLQKVEAIWLQYLLCLHLTDAGYFSKFLKQYFKCLNFLLF